MKGWDQLPASYSSSWGRSCQSSKVKTSTFIQGDFFNWDPPISVPKRKPPGSQSQHRIYWNSSYDWLQLWLVPVKKHPVSRAVSRSEIQLFSVKSNSESGKLLVRGGLEQSRRGATGQTWIPRLGFGETLSQRHTTVGPCVSTVRVSRQNCSDGGGDMCLVWPSPVFQASAVLCHYHVPSDH